MYIDPNTGGALFQILVCGVPLIVIGVVVGAVAYFVGKGKKNQKSKFSKNKPT